MAAKKKYKFTGEISYFYGVKVQRIQAVRSFGYVKKGDLGGWIESAKNLSHDGNAWVDKNAVVVDNAVVSGDAVVSDNAFVYNSAKVDEHAYVYEHACVSCDAHITNSAQVKGHAAVDRYACVMDNGIVTGHAHITDDAIVCNNALVTGDAVISGKVKIKLDDDYSVYKNNWSSFRTFTYTRPNKKWKVGCFYGTGKQLIAKAYKDGMRSGRCYEAIVKAQEAIDDARHYAKQATEKKQ